MTKDEVSGLSQFRNSEKEQAAHIIEYAYIDGYGQKLQEIEKHARDYQTYIETYQNLVNVPGKENETKTCLESAEESIMGMRHPLGFILDYYRKLPFITKMSAEGNKASLVVIDDLLIDAQKAAEKIGEYGQDNTVAEILFEEMVYRNPSAAAETARICYEKRKNDQRITDSFYWSLKNQTSENPLKQRPEFDRFIDYLVGIAFYAERMQKYKEDKSKRDIASEDLLECFRKAVKEVRKFYKKESLKESIYDFYAPLIVCRDLLTELDAIIKKTLELPKKALSIKSISMYRIHAISNALRRIGHASYIEKLKILNPQSKRIK